MPLRGAAAGVLATAVAIAAVSAAIALIDNWVAVLGLAVLYLLAVLPIAIVWGTAFGVVAAVASMLTFNFFFLDPVYTFRITDGGNWVALVVFVITAVIVSELAALARRRAAEAALLAGEAREAEALRRSDSVKTALLRTVSHDLRSPLMAILTSSSALAARDLELDTDDRRELIATITSEAGRLDRLVADLLDLSRIQSGPVPARTELWPLDDLVGQALEELGPDADRVQIALPDQPVPVSVDPGQIQRVLANLLENALKYSPPTARVDVTVTADEREAVARVTDHGAGIAAADLERIFEPFQRGTAAVEARGAGLGLAIARGFAEANGGRVWAESPPGHGATFVLALPVSAAVEVEA